jgi:hypothetical protein
MEEPHKIDVKFSNGQWKANFGGFYFGSRDLALLIETFKMSFPDTAFILVVDRLTIEGHATAEPQFPEISAKNAALVISSTSP